MRRYPVRQSGVTPYSPANHTGTKNFRLTGPETVGAKQLEAPPYGENPAKVVRVK